MNPISFHTRCGLWRPLAQRWLVILGVLWFSTVMAQGPQPERGPRNVDPRWHALVHARVIPEPGRVIEDATIVVRDGVIQWVTAGGTPPPGARVWDYTGRTIVAGFVESHYLVETPLPPEDAKGNHWNHSMVTPQRSALDGDGISEEDRAELRGLGFTSAAIAPRGGMFRGISALVALGDDNTEVADRSAEIIEPALYQDATLARARFSWSSDGPNRAAYPTSSMGSVALMRQTCPMPIGTPSVSMFTGETLTRMNLLLTPQRSRNWGRMARRVRLFSSTAPVSSTFCAVPRSPKSSTATRSISDRGWSFVVSTPFAEWVRLAPRHA